MQRTIFYVVCLLKRQFLLYNTAVKEEKYVLMDIHKDSMSKQNTNEIVFNTSAVRAALSVGIQK